MDNEFFTGNRTAIFNAVDEDVIIIAGNVSMQRSNDTSYVFQQEANFWYLTGINAPGWWLIIEKSRSSLVAPNVDEVHRIFDGSLSDVDAQKMSGVDSVLSHKEGEELLADLKKQSAKISTLGEDPHKAHYDFALNPGPVEMLAKLQDVFGEVSDCRKELAKLRAIKQPKEVQVMREAISVTIDAFQEIKSKIDTYSTEYEIEADFTHYFRSRGAAGHAYDPIVASGKNAGTLHYIKNYDDLTKGELILLDIGASAYGYAADITRTYAYGDVSDRHKAVHLAVEMAHKEIITLLKSGLAVKEYFEKVDVIMMKAMSDLGLLKEKADYRKYFPHSISHGLGIDVHDSLGGPETFLPGMVLTVEPGIYIPEEGIGVRIEDDILITEDGHENLSASLSASL